MKRLKHIEVVYENHRYRVAANIQGDSKKLIVFLHGWGATKECFDDAFKFEDFQGYAICALDMLGYGQSDKPHNFSYDLADQANVVAAAIRSLSPQEVFLVGHSMGGGVGLLCMASLEALIKKFICVEGNLLPSDTSSRTRILAKQPFWLFKYLSFPALKRIAAISPDPNTRIWASWIKASDPWAFYKSSQSLVGWSDNGKLLPLFKDLPAKAYVYGEKGNREHDVVPQLKDIETCPITDSEHFPMLDNPNDFYATISRLITT
jgi:pimeloyl-ACP methyl ester carboxylesterase